VVAADFVALQNVVSEMDFSLDVGMVARTITAIALIGFVPGFLALRVFFPERENNAETIILSLGISLAIVTCVGLALNAAHRLTADGWIAALAGISVAALPLVVVRWTHRPRLRVAPVMAVAASLLLVSGSLILARYGALHHRQFAYTEFWMLPTKGTNLVTIGIKNQEKRAVTYNLDLILDGATVGQFEQIELAEAQVWTKEVAVAFDPALDQRFEARLYRYDRPSLVYRKVWVAKVATQRLEGKLNGSEVE
jgi:uncharacterized membrane protein